MLAVPFDGIQDHRCTSQALINQGHFVINRMPAPMLVPGIPPPAYANTQFVAKLNVNTPRNMATLTAASTIGYCNWVSTAPPYKKCGMAKALMYTCFTDDIITENGGFKPLTDKKWKDEKKKQQVAEVCLTMIYLQCRPIDDDGQPLSNPGVCILYLKTAVKARFEMMFTGKLGFTGRVYTAMKTADAVSEFGTGAAAFIEKYGDTWFFCHCDPSKQPQCLNIK